MVFKPQTFYGDRPEIAETETTPDAIEEASVAEALARAGTLDASNVQVTSIGSTVILQGTVAFAREIPEASEIAARIAGVTEVKNLLTATSVDETDVDTTLPH